MTKISNAGFWLALGTVERFVVFEHFPWFRDATISQLFNVVQESERHLCWPDLDVDIDVDSIDHPERYPLVSSRPSRGGAA